MSAVIAPSSLSGFSPQEHVLLLALAVALSTTMVPIALHSASHPPPAVEMVSVDRMVLVCATPTTLGRTVPLCATLPQHALVRAHVAQMEPVSVVSTSLVTIAACTVILVTPALAKVRLPPRFPAVVVVH